MNRDDVIRWAREVGLHLPYWADDEDAEKDPPRWTMVSPLPLLLERFAAAAFAAGAAAERQAMLETIDALYNSQDPNPMYQEGYNHALYNMEEFVKARSKS